MGQVGTPRTERGASGQTQWQETELVPLHPKVGLFQNAGKNSGCQGRWVQELGKNGVASGVSCTSLGSQEEATQCVRTVYLWNS